MVRKADVYVGGIYAVKVSGKIVPVRIDYELPNGGYVGTNLTTKRVIKIRSFRRLRRHIPRIKKDDMILQLKHREPGA